MSEKCEMYTRQANAYFILKANIDIECVRMLKHEI